MADQVITRFAPSPTGFLHLGSARTALFAWLYAKSYGGLCLLRLEDTDKERSQQKFIDSILGSFQWLRVSFDGEPFYQSQNKESHIEKANFLLDSNQAYYCNCSTDRLKKLREEQQKNGIKPKYDGKCRELNLGSGEDCVIRFKNPKSGLVIFDDIVRGIIEIANEELDDLILVKSDGSPTYNLSVVVDDIDMGITHVIRGDDHINNTPRQMNIFEALGAEIPNYGHVPMILGEDGKRMSKRHGAISLSEYKDLGVLPEALLNYLVRLGWSLGDQELFDIDQLKEKFKTGKINNSPASFSLDKLLWYSKKYISDLDNKSLINKISDYSSHFKEDPKSLEVLDLIKDRCSLLSDFKKESDYFFEDYDEIEPKISSKIFNNEAIQILLSLVEELDKLKHWTVDNINSSIKDVMSSNHISMAKVGQPFRLSITGQTHSPSIDRTAAILGKEKVLFRIKKVIKDFS